MDLLHCGDMPLQPLREVQKLPDSEISVATDSHVEQVHSRQLKPVLLLVVYHSLGARLRNWD